MKVRSTIPFLFLLFTIACSSPKAAAVDGLTPYITPLIVQSIDVSSPTQPQIPIPTPTPFIHTVASGETMSSIALRYGVETSAVMAANPNVNPNAMSVGVNLVIPSQSGAGIALANTTPLPLKTGPLTCTRSRDGSIGCFLLVQNDQTLPVESLQAKVAVANSQTGQAAEQLTTAPLNVLYPGKALALSVVFTSDIPDPIQSRFEMVSAVAVQDGENRYLQTQTENLQVTKDANGLSARIYGEVSLLSSGLSASAVWAAGIAFDRQGNIVGVRRWEGSTPLISGQKLPFTFSVYSTGAAIDRVEVLLEARK
jgi:LysM repeat protein